MVRWAGMAGAGGASPFSRSSPMKDGPSPLPRVPPAIANRMVTSEAIPATESFSNQRGVEEPGARGGQQRGERCCERADRPFQRREQECLREQTLDGHDDRLPPADVSSERSRSSARGIQPDLGSRLRLRVPPTRCHRPVTHSAGARGVGQPTKEPAARSHPRLLLAIDRAERSTEARHVRGTSSLVKTSRNRSAAHPVGMMSPPLPEPRLEPSAKQFRGGPAAGLGKGRFRGPTREDRARWVCGQAGRGSPTR